MKKFIAVLGIVALCMQLSYAQKPVNNDLPDRLFKQGKEMFLDSNYVGCQNSLGEFLKLTKDEQLKIEAEYMILCSDYFMGKSDVGLQLKDYLDSHPETYHQDQLRFYIGSTHFEQKEWAKALFWFSQADVDYLSAKEQEDYAFRGSYANLQAGDIEKARQGFGLLSQNSQEYKEPAIFYLAYIDFKKGNYDKALRVFEQYKNKPGYQEEATFFLIQGKFLNNDLRGAIADAEEYERKYANSKNLVEVYRILGNSYNRTGNANKSIDYYEKYLSLENNPIREDMYLLGTSYSKKGDYNQAIKRLQLVASTTDALGQAAYMQLGQNYMALNDNTNALLSFDAAAREKYDPTISEVALYNYAVLVHKTSLSAFDQSVTVLERFLDEYPKSSYVKNINGLLASTYLSTKNHKAALTAINRLKSPDNQILAAKQSILFKIGTEDFINSDYSSALNDFSQSISLGNYDAVARRQAYFWRGETYYRMGNYSSASSDYNNYLSSAPASDENYALALYNLGYTHFQLKQYGSASSSFQKYVAQERNKSKNTYSDALNRIGDIHLFNRNYSSAENSYSQAAAQGGSGADYADFQKAFVLGLQRNYSGKVSALDAMMRKYPNSQYRDDALYEKSRALVMLNQDNEAIRVLETLMSGNPRPDMAQQAGVQLGQTYFNNNNYTKALEAYKKVVAVNPNTEDGRMAIQSMESIYKELNDISAYASYVNSLGTGVVISSTRQDSLTYQAAENIFMKGQNENARSAMQKYLQSYPNGAFVGDAHFNLGSIAYNKNDMSTALSEFMSTVKSKNSKYMNEALEYAAKLQYERSSYQEAYDLYKQLNNQALSSDVKHTAQVGMLRCASVLNKDSEVVSVANTLLAGSKVSPEIEAEARFLRGKSYLSLKQTDKAMTDLQQVAKDTRTVSGAEAQYLIAGSYYSLKQYDKAEKQLFDFIKLGTPHEYWMARAFILLSDNYLAKGDKFQARQYLESLQANYKNPEADIASMINQRLAALKN